MACQEMIDYHEGVDEDDTRVFAQMPYTIMDLCEGWEANLEGVLYWSPIVSGQLPLGLQPSTFVIPPTDSRN